MRELIQQLRERYADQVADIEIRGEAELAIILKNGVEFNSFSQQLQDHLIEIIDQQSIIKVDILDSDRNTVDAFATNQ